jgi:RNA methyltransferase, TrmH family
MNNKTVITSPKNPRIRELIDLQKPRHRKESGLIIIEGLKEAKMAVSAGVEIHSVFFCKELIQDINTLPFKFNPNAGYEMTEVSKAVYAKIAYRENSSGFILTATRPERKLQDLRLSEKPLVIVLENVEKPGNLGAVLRTADAAGVDAVLVCDSQTDLYNPNVIRASLGCIFSVPVVSCSSTEARQWMEVNGIKAFVTSLEASRPYTECDFKSASAIVMGSEDRGVSEYWKKHSFQNMIIPMQGRVDSMNISVSSAIIVFEALRQRKIKA